jgi:hypothetical protein
MAISESVVWERWEKIGGACECEKPEGKCRNKLVFVKRGQNAEGGWNALEVKKDESKAGEPEVRIYCSECLKNHLEN